MRKAVILAGGTGSRLSPITRVINKHLLPVGSYPMIYWSILKAKEAGLHEILILTSREHLAAFIQLLGDGKDLGVHLHYTIQDQADGIASALSLAEHFVGDEKFLVLLGDNLFADPLTAYVQQYEKQKEGAFVLLKEVRDPTRYGIAFLDETKQKIKKIVEKPNMQGSAYCVTGIYMYDRTVFSFIEQIAPSARGELEITDVNNFYIDQGTMGFNILPDWWIDAGTHESLFKANCYMNQTLDLAGGES
ncbi:sugar phosphate nucleotidyltransferase [Halalkalibacterium halodurans]|uniref:Glucose-1-phosphate thymidylyltransferase n=1 Tax=Halalkalibacterium halodurans (strain ATCC BAA-125 / DSM 18197 / FERM 7344 / JCM 9153 / C-125) TaxID=272558 RepID=Q9K7J8_HALH5|nr:sugar phosphate nucleotidyltransferase [Halalkalibacterium halodurans]MDY7223895.1 sugar phosphate nucleotidyltransferase [Halalkalibacterium halodurans]MDY7243116.1 sugar phosphate nucleotidyltransferase [Halalkalibacterium halodurans]MED4080639.1 sugar phosphate nucleotidyltransferase [Halalkalibacterium halodurans]MED4085674.1 sugar phosphate nucleotidyltransferase [Halalkalibacterium halodurans]MED4106326.1 sugar phosphate nucleotidyltransferase [Halalkalibacterium halodurans]